MLNRIFYILPELAGQDFSMVPAPNRYFVIPVDAGSKASMDAAYRFFDQQTVPQYTPAFGITGRPGPGELRYISSFAFLPSMLRMGGKPVFCLTGDSSVLINEAAVRVSTFLRGQGIPEVEWYGPDVPGAGSFVVREQGQSFQEYYSQLLRNTGSYNNNVFIKADSVQQLNDIDAMLSNEEQKLEKENPALSTLLSRLVAMEAQLTRTNMTIAALEQELENHRQYNAILRSEHTAKELQTYYDHEYEVLPGWYKRVGHIIKVIMGKRTFRSLYRDDVKKYK